MHHQHHARKEATQHARHSGEYDPSLGKLTRKRSDSPGQDLIMIESMQKSASIVGIKPIMRERKTVKERHEKKSWPFFDDLECSARIGSCENDPHFHGVKNVATNGGEYDAVDHVSILLGSFTSSKSEDFMIFSRKQDILCLEKSIREHHIAHDDGDSVWLKRRRAAMVERRVPGDSLLLKGKVVDKDGFLVEGFEAKPPKTNQSTEIDGWISFDTSH